MKFVSLPLFFVLLFATAWSQPLEGSFSYQGQDVPVKVFLPDTYSKGQPPPLMVTLPPGPGNADMVNANLNNYWLKEGLRRGYVVVAPEIFGRSLDQDPGRFTDDLFRWLSGRLTFDRRNVVLTGQSNGGIGAFHLATSRPNQFKALIVLPGQYTGQMTKLSSLRNKPIWMLVGEKDDPARWAEPVQETYEQLKKYRAKVRLDVLPGQGHVFRVQPSVLYDWLEAQ